jgi:hypothetical protein
MYITGRTSNRLSELKTLDVNNPYKVGINGVLNVQTDFIEYEIDDIYYKTFFNKTFQNGPKSITKNQKKIKTYTAPNYVTEPYKQDTIFKLQKIGDDFEQYPLIKEENKLEQVFLPEIEDEIFIERGVGNVYEKHMRLSDINNIGRLETYKNGFYYIKKS